MRPHVEHNVQLWGLQHHKGIDLLESPEKATEMVWSPSALKPGWWGWGVQPKEEKLQGHLIVACCNLKGVYGKEGEGLYLDRQ